MAHSSASSVALLPAPSVTHTLRTRSSVRRRSAAGTSRAGVTQREKLRRWGSCTFGFRASSSRSSVARWGSYSASVAAEGSVARSIAA